VATACKQDHVVQLVENLLARLVDHRTACDAEPRDPLQHGGATQCRGCVETRCWLVLHPQPAMHTALSWCRAVATHAARWRTRHSSSGAAASSTPMLTRLRSPPLMPRLISSPTTPSTCANPSTFNTVSVNLGKKPRSDHTGRATTSATHGNVHVHLVRTPRLGQTTACSVGNDFTSGQGCVEDVVLGHEPAWSSQSPLTSPTQRRTTKPRTR